MLELARIDEFAVLFLAQVDAVKAPVLFSPSRDDEGVPMATGGFHPVSCAAGVIFACAKLGDQTFKAQLACVVEKLCAVHLPVLAVPDGVFDILQENLEHALAVEQR